MENNFSDDDFEMTPAEARELYDSETAAENAWLRHAEASDFYDDPRGA